LSRIAFFGREFQVKHDGFGIGRLDLVDHQQVAEPRAQHALRRKDDLVKARGNIVRGQQQAIVELDARADLEGPGSPVVDRLRHLGA